MSSDVMLRLEKAAFCLFPRPASGVGGQVGVEREYCHERGDAIFGCQAGLPFLCPVQRPEASMLGGKVGVSVNCSGSQQGQKTAGFDAQIWGQVSCVSSYLILADSEAELLLPRRFSLYNQDSLPLLYL